jgi:YHS domain-containing protein
MWVLVLCFLITGMFVMGGCRKKSEPTQTAQNEQALKAVEKTVEEAKEAAATVVEQKVCPIMGAPINKELYAQYKGQKVYFCCPGCKETFEKNPEQYTAKLPQFNN